jgi:signal transduction histidine kinase
LISKEVQDFEARTGVETYLDISEPGLQSVPSAAAINIFRVVESALANVMLHSRARRVEVLFSAATTAVFLPISDDGGAPPAGIRHEGLGILGMRERMLLLGGELEVLSDEGGVKVLATIPWSALE